MLVRKMLHLRRWTMARQIEGLMKSRPRFRLGGGASRQINASARTGKVTMRLTLARFSPAVGSQPARSVFLSNVLIGGKVRVLLARWLVRDIHALTPRSTSMHSSFPTRSGERSSRWRLSELLTYRQRRSQTLARAWW